ncbi:hypothetical protein P7C70_g4828, partial [Phenoliferia sp. Uapishka_3]
MIPTRESFSTTSPLVLQSTSQAPFKNPYAAARPPRPEVHPGQVDIGPSEPFASKQEQKPVSPARPPRPARPDEALLFNLKNRAKSSQLLADAEPGSRVSHSSFDSETQDLATFVMLPNPTASPNSTHSFQSSPLVPSTLGSPAVLHPRTTSADSRRLSLSGFEALLSQPVPTSPILAAQSTAGHPPLSPVDKGKGREYPAPVDNDADLHHDPSAFVALSRSHKAKIDSLDFGAMSPSSDISSQFGWERVVPDRRSQVLGEDQRDKLARVKALQPEGTTSPGFALSPNPNLGNLGLGVRRRSSIARFDPGVPGSISMSTPGRQIIEMPRQRGSKEASERSLHYQPYQDDVGEGASLRRGRVNLAMIDYAGWFPRLCHLIFPLLVLAQYPATLFLDYNVIYTLIQLAISPTLPSKPPPINLSTFIPSFQSYDAIPVPTVRSTTVFWVAVGVYGLCTLLWVAVVCLWLEFWRGYLSLWEQGGQVRIGRVYSTSASLRVPGTKVSDGVLETCSWYVQNWPTILLLIPRAGISLAILLLYGTTAYGSRNPATMTRDIAYFQPNGTLTNYAAAILLANLAWAAFRLALVACSALGLLFFDSGPHHQHSPETLPYDMSSPDSTRTLFPVDRNPATYRARRTRRIRAAILLCASTSPRTMASTPGTTASFSRSPSKKWPPEYRRGDLPRGNKNILSPYITPSPRLTTYSSPTLHRTFDERHSRGASGMSVYIDPASSFANGPHVGRTLSTSTLPSIRPPRGPDAQESPVAGKWLGSPSPEAVTRSTILAFSSSTSYPGTPQLTDASSAPSTDDLVNTATDISRIPFSSVPSTPSQHFDSKLDRPIPSPTLHFSFARSETPVEVLRDSSGEVEPLRISKRHEEPHPSSTNATPESERRLSRISEASSRDSEQKSQLTAVDAWPPEALLGRKNSDDSNKGQTFRLSMLSETRPVYIYGSEDADSASEDAIEEENEDRLSDELDFDGNDDELDDDLASEDEGDAQPREGSITPTRLKQARRMVSIHQSPGGDTFGALECKSAPSLSLALR